MGRKERGVDGNKKVFPAKRTGPNKHFLRLYFWVNATSILQASVRITLPYNLQYTKSTIESEVLLYRCT